MIDIQEMTVLIADDMPNMVTTIRSMLKVLKYGRRFIPAENGREAWRFLKKKTEELIDIAIIDYNMPEMSGSELLTRIRSDKDLRDLPVVMITGNANMEFVAEAAESDIDAYILKPPTMKVLKDKVWAVVENANRPSPMVCHLRKARSLEEQGKIDEAISEARLAMEANPESSKPVNELGCLFLGKGRFEEAEKWLLKAAEMNPLDVSAFHNLGKLYVRFNDIDAAFKYLKKAMDINPRDLTRAVYFGTILLEKKKLKEATRIFDNALGLNKDNEKLKEQIADLCIEKGATAYAVNLLESVLKSSPDKNGLSAKLGILLEEIGEYAKALGYLTRAEKEDNSNMDIKLRLARVHLGLGKPLRAEKPLKEILKANPAHEEAENLLRNCV